jgi:ACS family hexuronate transporter-like MFS transporter
LIVWSLASIGHGFVKSTVGFFIARSTLGISEAGNFPAAIKSVAEWFPKKERAWQPEFLTREQQLSYFSTASCSFYFRHYGWRETFVWIGALGLLWIVLWWRFYNIPEKLKI